MQKHLYDCDLGCPVQNTLQFIAGKWKSVILYHLLQDEVLRFSELQRKLPYVSKRMLAKQLVELETDGILIKHRYDTIPVKSDYRLSKLGLSLSPVINAMVVWGEAYIDALATQDKQAIKPLRCSIVDY